MTKAGAWTCWCSGCVLVASLVVALQDIKPSIRDHPRGTQGRCRHPQRRHRGSGEDLQELTHSMPSSTHQPRDGRLSLIGLCHI